MTNMLPIDQTGANASFWIDRKPWPAPGSDPLVEFLLVVYPPGAASCDEDSLMRHGGKEYGTVTRGRVFRLAQHARFQ